MQALRKSGRTECVHAQCGVHTGISLTGKSAEMSEGRPSRRAADHIAIHDYAHSAAAGRIGAPPERQHPAEVVDRGARDHFPLRWRVDRTKRHRRGAVAADDRPDAEQLLIPFLVGRVDAQSIVPVPRFGSVLVSSR